ncbi:TetR/AcrR family transcriptional regulator [Chengkuizengella sediminis]|uniref:TetR/AcrR family transcriptional regulator n=1 Tax=Chengkuizengella sediminis TaxID=1885917 RepID=UPI001389C070|nr:TetR/AcrR family transcriptional regulator [Chengkuizengella sediminis]NDI33566.1 TetR/AcrR family transcriptional regulator [Chengkuizengella sediminis]
MSTGFNKDFEHNEALMKASLNEFITRGYEKASINHILKMANMSKGSFYYHFKNKEDLYFHLIQTLIEKKQAFLSKAMTVEDYSTDIFSIFKTQIRLGMQFAVDYPDINRFANSFVKEKGNDIYERALKKYNFENNDQINQMIEASYHKGEFRENLPIEFIKRIIGFLFTHLGEITDISKPEHIEQEMNYFIDFLKMGLTKERRE